MIFIRRYFVPFMLLLICGGDRIAAGTTIVPEDLSLSQALELALACYPTMRIADAEI